MLRRGLFPQEPPQREIAIAAPEWRALVTGRFSGLGMGRCPGSPHSLLWQASPETPQFHRARCRSIITKSRVGNHHVVAPRVPLGFVLLFRTRMLIAITTPN